MRIYLCPYCEAQLPDGARFCVACGGAIAQPDEGAPGAGTASNIPTVEESIPQPESVTSTLEIDPPVVAPAYRPNEVAGRVEASTDSGSAALPIPENLAAVLAYATIVPAVVFLLVEPFRRNRFVRFHAWQHLLLFGAAAAGAIAASILWMVLELLPFMRVLVFPFAGLIGLAWVFIWLLLVVKAYHHAYFKLPYLGDLAEERAED